MSLAQNIKRLREAKIVRRSMSQSELATKVGLEPSAISHFECGRRVPCLKNLMKLAKAFDVTLDELVNGSFHD